MSLKVCRLSHPPDRPQFCRSGALDAWNYIFHSDVRLKAESHVPTPGLLQKLLHYQSPSKKIGPGMFQSSRHLATDPPGFLCFVSECGSCPTDLHVKQPRYLTRRTLQKTLDLEEPTGRYHNGLCLESTLLFSTTPMSSTFSSGAEASFNF